MKNLLLSLLGIVLIVSSCQEARDQMKEDLKPTARGEIGEIILIMDSTQWSGPLGEQIKDLYRAPMPGLPQAEPMFDLHKVNPLKINDVFRSSANMIFVMTLDSKTYQSQRIREYFTNNSLKIIQGDSSLFMTLHKDEFAKGQVVLYLFSQMEDLLIQKLKENKVQLVSIFENIAIEKTREKLTKSKETQLMAELKEDFGFEITIPLGWEQAKKTKNFVWLRRLEASSEQDLFIHSEPYTDQSIFEDIGSYRDKITETFLRDSEKPDKYITRQLQDFVPLETKQISFKGSFAIEARGLWKISDNSGGGPFISYTIVDEANQRVYYIEGYVYSPGTDKKNLVREVDAILTTFNLPPAEK
ncbi:MAG: DUF4837 family protein [Bacteroidota bacterium]